MKKYVALLRGINVGGHNKIAMSELKEAFESFGYENVATYINSGNVIFETDQKDVERIVDDIEGFIRKHFGLPIRVVVRTRENIIFVIQSIPATWSNDQSQKTDVMFLWDEYAHEGVLQQIETSSQVDQVSYVDQAIIWHFDKMHSAKSKIELLIGTDLYKNMTVRNVNTVRKLADLMQ